MKKYVILVGLVILVISSLYPWLFGWICLALVMGVISIGLLPHTYFEPEKRSRP